MQSNDINTENSTTILPQVEINPKQIEINDYNIDIMHIDLDVIVWGVSSHDVKAPFDLVHEWLCFEGILFEPIGKLASCCRPNKDLEMMTEVEEYLEKEFGIRDAQKLATYLYTHHNHLYK